MDGVKGAPITTAVKKRKCGGISHELDTAHGVTIKDILILKRFQVHSTGNPGLIN